MEVIQFTARQILVHSIVDGMNRYVNQVLLPANLIADEDWRHADNLTCAGGALCKQKYEIAEDIAAKWEKALEARIKRRWWQFWK